VKSNKLLHLLLK